MTKNNRKNQIKKTATNWRDTIDGWVNDPTIRWHFLIALGMVLIAAVTAIGLATSLTTTTILVGGATSAGTTWWLRQRRRRRPPAATSRGTRPELAEDRRSDRTTLSSVQDA